MITNLQEFSMTIEDKYTHIRFSTNNESNSVFISNKELCYFLNSIQGNSDFYPWFDDLNYLIRPHVNGFQFLSLSKQPVEKLYINFPFNRWERLINFLEQRITGSEIKLEPAEKNFLSDLVKPNVTVKFNHYTKIIYTENSFDEIVVANLSDSILKWGELYPELLRCISSVNNIAMNYSDGNKIVVNLYFDELPKEGIPDSYYFNIMSEDSRLLNGGIMYHRGSNSYSLHT